MHKRWRSPQPLPFGLRAADGVGVLGEDLCGLGMLLWDVARDVACWADAPRSDVSELFAPLTPQTRIASLMSARLDPMLEAPLAELIRTMGEPGSANRLLVSLACRRVSLWAEDQGGLATAAAFAHAAALVCFHDASLAYVAGRLARRRAEYARAEGWLRRAVALGRQNEDWESYGAAWAGLGNVFIQRGDYPRAKKYHLRCLRAALRHELRPLVGDAYHNLLVVAGERGDVEEVNRYARLARYAFGDRHPRLATLAHDVAYVWMEQGYFARALEVFEAAKPHFRRDQYVLVLADICRAAAGAADIVRFESAWAETHDWIDTELAQDHAAQALLDLARGAAHLNAWNRAEQAILRSLRLAIERREARVRITAEAVLESIRSERMAGDHAVVTPTVEEAFSAEVQLLASDFVQALNQCATAGV